MSPRPAHIEQQPDKPSQALDPYTENRILTPSQFRHGGSPKREFGTQTANFGPSAYSGIEIRVIFKLLAYLGSQGYMLSTILLKLGLIAKP